MLGPVDFSIDKAPKVHFSNLAKEFSKLGFDVLCVVYAPKKGTIVTMADKFKVFFAPNPLTGNLFLRTLKYIFFIPVLLWIFFKFGPFVVYFRFSPPAFLYLLFLNLIKFFFHFKIILEFNSWVPEERAIESEGESMVRLIKFLQVNSALFADYIRVVSEGIKGKLLLCGMNESKIAVIGNGTDINHFKPMDKIEAKKGIGLDPDYLYVGFIGNFAIWQGLDYLIQAIPSVLKANNKIRFILVGDGPEMSKMQKKVSQFKNKEVLLTGRVTYKEAVRYINAFDIGVAPFIEERNASIGLSPLKIRDYAACGVPIITSRIAGLEMVEEENFGILVPPDDSAALSRAIIELLNKTKMRKEMGKKGRKIAEKYYSWKVLVNQILELTCR
jgi:glycosyltransferase involved in cell wall biosynthesis